MESRKKLVSKVSVTIACLCRFLVTVHYKFQLLGLYSCERNKFQFLVHG